MSTEREAFLEQVIQEGEEGEGFVPSPPERQERIEVARQVAREGEEGEAPGPARRPPRPQQFPPGEPAPSPVARPTPTREPLPQPRRRIPALAVVAALAPAALAEPTPLGELALAAAVVLILLVQGGKAVLDALPRRAPAQDVLDEIERALREDRTKKETDAIIRDIELELKRQRTKSPGGGQRARERRARAAAVAIAKATPVRSTGDPRAQLRAVATGPVPTTRPTGAPKVSTKGAPATTTVTPAKPAGAKPAVDPGPKTGTGAQTGTGAKTGTSAKTDTGTQTTTKTTKAGRALLPRGFELPTGKVLPSGVFPKIVEFGQGIVVKRINLLSGKVSSRPIRPGESPSPKVFFRVIETTKTRPPRRTFTQGLFSQRITRRKIIFSKRRGL